MSQTRSVFICGSMGQVIISVSQVGLVKGFKDLQTLRSALHFLVTNLQTLRSTLHSLVTNYYATLRYYKMFKVVTQCGGLPTVYI